MPKPIRITWDDCSIETFLDLLVENKCKRKGGKYNWDQIVPQLNIRANSTFDKKKVNNFYNDLKAKFQAWDELKSWTGLGWDENGCPVIDRNDDKWLAFLQKYNGKPSCFLKTPLPFEEKCYEVFKGTYAAALKSRAPSAMRPNLLDMNKEPTNIAEEGSGDSKELDEDDNGGFIDLSARESRSPTKTTSSKKRKSVDSGCVSSKRNTKADIDLCLDVLKKSMNIGSSSKSLNDPPPSKYERMLSILQQIPEVVQHGKGFMVEVLDYLRDPDCGKLFLSLPDNEFRLIFLKKKVTFPGDCYIPSMGTEDDFFDL